MDDALALIRHFRTAVQVAKTRYDGMNRFNTAARICLEYFLLQTKLTIASHQHRFCSHTSDHKLENV